MLPHVEEMLARINACHAAQGSLTRVASRVPLP